MAINFLDELCELAIEDIIYRRTITPPLPIALSPQFDDTVAFTQEAIEGLARYSPSRRQRPTLFATPRA